MTINTHALVRQLRDALLTGSAVLCRHGKPTDPAMTAAIAAADQWLAQPPAQQERKPSTWAGFLGADLDKRMAPARELVTHMLSAAPQPPAKPCAWACVWPEEVGGGGFTTLDEQTALNYMEAADLRGCRPTLVPLYATPQPSVQAERLTDGQIVGLAIGAGVEPDDEDDDGTTVFAIARAIETACAVAWGVKLEGDAPR